ncbi:MAG: MurR/RpiR family transcriptional regulator [Mycoplasmatales bacterium]
MNRNIILNLQKIAREKKDNQSKLAKYLLEYQGDISKLKIQEIADILFISPPAGSRLAKQLNLSGFSELKIYLEEEKKEQKNEKMMISSLKIENYCSELETTIENTLKNINEENIITIGIMIRYCEKVDLYGVGASSFVLQDLFYKLTRVNVRTTSFSDHHLQIPQAFNSNENTISIAMSYSGETKEILKCLKIAKKKGATTVLITKQNNKKYDYIDFLIHINAIETSYCDVNIFSRIGALTVFDLIYISMIQSDEPYYQKILKDSKFQWFWK